MTTITGKLENTSGAVVHAWIKIKSKSTPLVGAGIVTGHTTTRFKNNATDGTFSVDLAAGKYDVTYETSPDNTKFEITVPDGSTTMSIEEVTSSDLVFVFAAPNTIWNGIRQGHITFDPVNDPAVPTLSEVAYTGGHVTDTDGGYNYRISYVTQDGETAACDPTAINVSGAANKAIRVTMEVSPTRVTSKRIWRNKVLDASRWYLLAEVGPTVTHYDDWESMADFFGRGVTTQAPEFNTTAGIIHSHSGIETLYFSTSGLRILAEMTVDHRSTFNDYVTFNSDVTFNGQILYGNPSDGQILTASGGIAIWAAAPSGGGTGVGYSMASGVVTLASGNQYGHVTASLGFTPQVVHVTVNAPAPSATSDVLYASTVGNPTSTGFDYFIGPGATGSSGYKLHWIAKS